MWITILIVVITYAGIAIGRWPIIRSNRATIVLIAVGMLLAAGQTSFEDLPDFLDFDTLFLLFAMMIINANLKLAGFFDLAGGMISRFARTPKRFLAAVILFAGMLSALFLNDTICLVFTPLVIESALKLKRNPIPYLIALAAASNVGSAATLTGNPQNMIIGISSGISYLDFSAALAPVAAAGLVIVWLVIVLLYPLEFSRRNPFVYPEVEPGSAPRQGYALVRVLVVVLSLLVALVSGVPIALASFLAACVLLVSRRNQPENIFSEINWGLLVFFAGLFIVSGMLEYKGITTLIFDRFVDTQNINVWNLSLSTTVLSNLVSNVPAVLLLRPVILRMTNPEAGWLTLAAISTLAGNLTLLGSVANLIVAEIAQAWRIDLTFREYTRAGALITAITLVMAAGWLALTAW